jgi:hypothetical protein
VVAALILTASLGAAAQLRPDDQSDRHQPEYDGRFTFVRARWRSDFSRRGGFGAAWNHDYPRAERHLSLILRELTSIDLHPDAHLVLTLDDPSLFNYPMLFMWEPGFWVLEDREAASFRAYLLKGGFAVFEDFDGPQQWSHFETQMRRVLPQARLVRLDNTHPIFDSFFRVRNIDAIVHPMSGIAPSYYGIFENNDPSRRLMVVANFDNDVPEYWEWSGEWIYPFDASNEAYKLGVNYVIYGLTR